MNHVVQQAKGQKIIQFQDSFGKVAAEVLGRINQEFPRDLKKKLSRVVNILKERNIFSKQVVNDIERSLKTESSPVEALVLPQKLKDFAKDYEKLVKMHHNVCAMKMRFDKSSDELDPSSSVYEENFKTISKIGNMAKDIINESILKRESGIHKLQSTLDDEKRHLDEEQNMLSEIEFVLSAKDPSRLNKNVDEDNIIPTYEVGDGDDDDDDGDNDDDDDDDDDDKNYDDRSNDSNYGVTNISTTDKKNEVVEKTDSEHKNSTHNPSDNQFGMKRTHDMIGHDDANDIPEKKVHLDSKTSEDGTFNSEDGHYELDIEGHVGAQTDEGVENSGGVSSSIQDLLSKLAN
ncbi:Rtt103 [Saccharomyces cerevisiae]|nr:Rtt103 [Saccharomyces cerevisiae]